MVLLVKYNEIASIIQKKLQQVYNNNPLLKEILDDICKHGGTAYFVGGMVRDMLLNRIIKDIDIELHGLTQEQLITLLQPYGTINYVGKSFGVFRLSTIDIDWSLPRIDNEGRKPHVVIDPFISIKEAFRRRDLTINAMGIDAMTGTLIDPFNGYEDLCNGILRAPDIDLFLQDPLRFFRVMQFISRFEMKPDKVLESTCKTMIIHHLSIDRIEQEFAKMLLYSRRPSLGIRWLLEIGRLQELLPELYATVATVQDTKWHPEGNVFEHSMQAIDAAAELVYKDNDEKLIMLYAALCHDLGKTTTTFEDEKGIHSYGHAEIGAEYAVTLLKRITRNISIVTAVKKLIYYHMRPGPLVACNAGLAAYKRLAIQLAPDITMHMLSQLFLADVRGRNGAHNSLKALVSSEIPPKQVATANGLGSEPLTLPMYDVELFIERSQEAGVLYAPEKPILQAADLFDVVTPGPELGRLLKKAYKMQIEGSIADKEVLKKRLLHGIKKGG